MPEVALFTRSAASVQEQLSFVRIEDWFDKILFHGKWWLLLGMFLFSVFVWCKTVDKSRLREITLYVAFVIIWTLVLDEIGEELTLWDYPYDLLPLFPPLSAIDIACLPLVYSLIYQYFRKWRSFVTATVVMSSVFCFIMEPLFVWIGIYQMLEWRSYYGLPIYILIAVASKFAVVRICGSSSK